MDQALEKAVLENLTKNIPSPQSMSYEDQLSSLVNQMEKHQINNKLESAFAQIMGKDETKTTVDHEDSFEQKLTFKNIISGEMLKKGFGASIAGQVGGIITGFLPINLGIAGVPAILGGLAVNRFAKGKTGSAISEGMVIGGMSVAIASLMGGSLNISGLLGSRATSTTPAVAGNVIF